MGFHGVSTTYLALGLFQDWAWQYLCGKDDCLAQQLHRTVWPIRIYTVDDLKVQQLWFPSSSWRSLRSADKQSWYFF